MKKRPLFGGGVIPKRLEFNDASLRTLTVLVLLLCGVSLIRLSWSSPGQRTTLAPAIRSESASVTSNQSISRPVVRAFAQQYLEAADIETLLGMTHYGVAMEETIRAYYRDISKLPIGGRVTDEIDTVVSQNGERMDVCSYEDSESKVHSMVILHRPEGLAVYWPAISGFCDMSVETFLRDKPEKETTLLVSAWHADYFNGGVFSPSTHLSFRMTDASDEHPFYGFLSKAALADVSLMQGIGTFTIGTHQQPETLGYTIRARFRRDAAEDGQVEITKIVCAGWFPP